MRAFEPHAQSPASHGIPRRSFLGSKPHDRSERVRQYHVASSPLPACACSGCDVFSMRQPIVGADGCVLLGRIEQLGGGSRFDDHGIDLLQHRHRARVWPHGVLFGNCWHTRHAAVAPFATQPPNNPRFSNSVSSQSVFARRCSRETVTLEAWITDATRRKPARQQEAVAAGFQSQRNPFDRAAGPDRLIPPAMQQGKQPFGVRLQLLARLTLNTRNDATNQPDRLAQLDDGNDRAILVEGGLARSRGAIG